MEPWQPAYWEVVLAQGQQTDLSGYHLLYICTNDLTGLDDFQADSLLEAVNEGAVLWIDSTDAASTTTGIAGAGTAWELSPFFCVMATDTASVGINGPTPEIMEGVPGAEPRAAGSPVCSGSRAASTSGRGRRLGLARRHRQHP